MLKEIKANQQNFFILFNKWPLFYMRSMRNISCPSNNIHMIADVQYVIDTITNRRRLSKQNL